MVKNDKKNERKRLTLFWLSFLQLVWCLQSFCFRFLHGYVLCLGYNGYWYLNSLQSCLRWCTCLYADADWLKLIWNSRMARGQLCENVVLGYLTNCMFNRVFQLAVLVMCIHACMTSSNWRGKAEMRRERERERERQTERETERERDREKKHVIIINVHINICMVLLFVEFYQHIPLSLTLLQGHLAWSSWIWQHFGGDGCF